VIVFDLKCGHGHVFEAWFGSSAAYEDQLAARMIACPICGDERIGKAAMAPNVSAKGNRGAVAAVAADGPTPEVAKAAMAMLAAAQAKMLEGSEYVGVAFDKRARAMHAGDEDAAPIHGQATAEQALALIEDGVAIAPLPLPVVPPETRN
jgi:hypothetical protein